MPHREPQSPKFRKWIADYQGVNFLDEVRYGNAIQAAEQLHANGEVTSAELVEMIKRASVLLLHLHG